MSKRSTVTVRRMALEDSASAGSQGLIVNAESMVVPTSQRIELVDVTGPLVAFVTRQNIGEGLLSVWSMHTTCAVFINEVQRALDADIRKVLEQLVDRDSAWLHNDPQHSDCDRVNADAHLRAMLLGHHLTLQISGGEPVLGQWQRVLMAELDGPRARTLRVQVWGVTHHA